LGRDLKDDLEQFYQQHRQGLFSMAVSMTGCIQQAEDAFMLPLRRFVGNHSWNRRH